MSKAELMYKNLVVLTLSLLLGLGLVMGASARQDNPFEGQAGMTDAEAQKYVDTLYKMMDAGNDQAKIMAILGESGMDQVRFAFVTTKFNAAMAIIKEGEAAKANIPPTMVPTDAEIAIVKKHEADYDKIITRAAK